MSASPELGVVCRSCGSEVSPYVTECPYCGARLRKRAPKLRREGDELRPGTGRRGLGGRLGGWRRLMPSGGTGGARPYVTLAAIVGPAALLLVQRAADRPLSDFGAIAEPLTRGEWWRYLAAPFAYTDVGYLFVIAVVLALVAAPLEERLGSIPLAILLVACGALGALAADGVESMLGNEVYLAAGGNGIGLGALAAWLVIRRAEVRRFPADDFDAVAVAVAAVVLLALPIVDDWANVWTGLAGGSIGAAAGFISSRLTYGKEN